MKNKDIQSVASFLLVAAAFLAGAQYVSAEQITVSIDGNGSGSSNSVSTTVESTTTVNQENNAEVTNDVDSDANTGDNSASGNTGGETNINTGDIQTETTVNNDNINSNYASDGSSATGSTTQISNNGAGSSNVVNTTSNSNTTVTQVNNAKITNNITTNANTGNNSADYNNGDVTIKTGNITAKHIVNNKNINKNIAHITGSCGDDCIQEHNSVIVKNNGAFSDNYLNLQFNNNKNSVTYNWADIVNNSVMNLNTGGNSADLNNGDIAIITGDIFAVTLINNENINSNVVKVECACVKKPVDEKPEGPPAVPPPPQQPGGGNGHVSNGGGGIGGGTPADSQDVLGAAIGNLLPATGNNLLLWVTLASLIAFFAGWYLRYRSGCAPNLAIA